jgi:hypothetical protein
MFKKYENGEKHENNLLRVNFERPNERSHSPLNGYKNSSHLIEIKENVNSASQRNMRGISTDKSMNLISNNGRSNSIERNLNSRKLMVESKNKIISAPLSFKECVNILHYGRLIFKYLVNLA